MNANVPKQIKKVGAYGTVKTITGLPPVRPVPPVPLARPVPRVGPKQNFWKKNKKLILIIGISSLAIIGLIIGLVLGLKKDKNRGPGGVPHGGGSTDYVVCIVSGAPDDDETIFTKLQKSYPSMRLATVLDLAAAFPTGVNSDSKFGMKYNKPYIFDCNTNNPLPRHNGQFGPYVKPVSKCNPHNNFKNFILWSCWAQIASGNLANPCTIYSSSPAPAPASQLCDKGNCHGMYIKMKLDEYNKLKNNTSLSVSPASKKIPQNPPCAWISATPSGTQGPSTCYPSLDKQNPANSIPFCKDKMSKGPNKGTPLLPYDPKCCEPSSSSWCGQGGIGGIDENNLYPNLINYCGAYSTDPIDPPTWCPPAP